MRVLGDVTDLTAGRIADQSTTRWGKFRPYVLFGSVPLLGLLVAVFSIPHGISSGEKLVWAYVSYALFQAAYRTVNIPYGSLAATMTQQPEERARLSTARMIFATLRMLRHNRPLVVLCASSLALYTGVFGAQTVGIYYARDVLGDTNIFIATTVAQTAGMRRPFRRPARPHTSRVALDRADVQSKHHWARGRP